MICQVGVIYWHGPFPPLITTVITVSIGASFLLAGLAAWRRWPASRLGLLFTITGYAWVLPSMAHLPYALPFTIGNLIANVYAAALAHLALAWPTGRLRSRFECGGRHRRLRLEYGAKPGRHAVLEPGCQRLRSGLPG